jgi:hypothetical protein
MRRCDGKLSTPWAVAVLAAALIAAIAFVVVHLLDQSEQHLQKIKETKVAYSDAEQFRPDEDECVRFVLDQLRKDPHRKSAKFSTLPLSEKALSYIGEMHDLQVLDLEATMVQNDWLRHLEHLPLQSLILSNTQVTDEGMEHIAKISSLRFLVLRDVSVGNRGMHYLAVLPELNDLVLGEADVTADGISELARLSSLRSLLVSTVHMTPQYADALSSLKQLTKLELGGCAVDAAVLAKLQHLTHLKDLRMINTVTSDSDLSALQGFASLERLVIWLANMTDAGLSNIGRCRHLLAVDLQCPRVSKAAMAGFKRTHPNCVIRN